jgi:hypothetical protein
VLLGPDEVSVDHLFAQCLARFEAMQAVDEDEAITIAPNFVENKRCNSMNPRSDVGHDNNLISLKN